MDNVVNSFLHLLHDTESFIRKSQDTYPSPVLADFLRDFRLKRINPLHKRLKCLNSERYVLSMIGLTNVGKSTLSHALLKHPVAPTGNSPSTAIPVEYEHGPEWLMKTFLAESLTVITTRFATAKDLSVSLKNRVLIIPGAHDSHIERVVVRGPMELLEGGLVVADTPGFGAIQFEDCQGSNKTSLVNYVREHVHEVLFCISGSNCVVKNEEVAFFDSIREMCSTVVVTKWDSEPDERAGDMETYKKKFAHLFPRCDFVFVEAKLAIEGQEKAKAGKSDDSYVDELRALIRKWASPDERKSAMGQQIINAWDELLELAREPLRKTGIASVPWHQAAHPRFMQAAGAQHLTLTSIP